MGLLRTIAIIFLVYFVFRFLARVVFPWLLNSYIKKKQSEMEQKFRDMNEPPKNEGEVTINKTSSSKKNSPDEGEFIDYEEVD